MELEGHDIIIEGHHIHPLLVKNLKKQFKNLKSIFIVKTQTKTIINDALKSKQINDWFIKKTKKFETYTKIAEMIKKYNLKTFTTDKNFFKSIDQAKNYLIDR